MKKSALRKDVFKNISNSKGRFISIVMIIALGVAFFSGLKKAPEDMKFTADNYYKDYNLFDIRVVSTLGLTDDDILEIEKIDGVKDLKATKYLDVVAKEGENDSVFRVFGYEGENQINGYRLLEGRFPEKSNECLIEIGIESEIRYEIGSRIKFLEAENDLTDELENTEFTVVGAVQSPYYLSFEKGNTNIGNGRISGYVVIPEENFKSDIYTDIYLKVKGTDDVNSYTDEYFNLTDPVVSKLENLAPAREKSRYDELINEANLKLLDAKDEYEKGKKEAEDKLNKAENEISKARLDLDAGQKELDRETENFNELIINGKNEIENVKVEIENGYATYNNNLATFNEASKNAPDQIEQAKKDIEDARNGINQLEDALVELEQGIENPHIPEETKLKLQDEYNEKSELLSAMLEKANNGENELNQKAIELEESKKELEKAKQTLDESRDKIEVEERRLKENERVGRIELEKNKNKIENGRRDLEKAVEDYNEGKKEAEKELEDAWLKIEDGEREIKKIEKATWHVLDRKSHYSYIDYEGAADRIDALSKVFPVFFALVAALVCLTSMTRMVDEQRVNIGTLKALGYKNLDIAQKYIIYALIASILGSMLGFAIGYTVFPMVIFNAYGLMYNLPPVILSFNWILSLKICIVAILLTTITAYLACIKELKENAASLMRPKAPKIGKRILLERVPFIWNRLNFSNKVTLRNIFRYKRRFFMTIFGIGGCTALILAGFGIKDSIRTVVDKQYGELFSYDIAITYEDGNERFIEDEDRITNFTISHEENGSLVKDKVSKDLVLVVPEDRNEFESFVRLQKRGTDEKITIPDKGIIISEQVAKSLSIDTGDEVIVKNKDEDEGLAVVSGITENYTFNYVYMSPEYYRDIFMKKVEYTNAYGSLVNTQRETEDAISHKLMEHDEIKRVSFNSILKEDFNDVIYSLNYVVLVMIVSAGALAFVVLYNLTSVNISERFREIATIKVLGFYDREVSAYIYRENIILTIIGTLLGLIMGIYLHKFIMITVEMENIMFGLSLSKLSYIYAIGLTFIFSVLVNISMHYRLKEIKMVESLKSVD